MENFYDKVAKKYGGYGFTSNLPKHTSVYPDGDPEKVFKDKLLHLASKSTVALDVGCGDGKFAFEIADNFSSIVGLDSSRELLNIAERKKRSLGVENVSFKFGDARNTPFKAQAFDLVFNRRGPGFYQEYKRILKPGGYYLEIGIGEKDAEALKKVFGRGQNYGGWNNSRLEADRKELEGLGFKIVFMKDYLYTEYYLSKQEFVIFLQGVPIFEDFDIEKDEKYLNQYVREFMQGDQVVLSRHRVVYVVQK
jgi:SAM-dependent methyltransferase